MKVALIHDYIKEYGGAERVLEALHELYPDAPVYTSVYLPEFLGPHKSRFKGWDIRTSSLQKVPGKEKLISIFRLIAPYAFRQFDFSAYDVVIVSATGAYFPNSIVTSNKQQALSKKPIHICYCHTPPRYLYGFATAREWKKNPVVRVAAEVANKALRMLDLRASKNVDFYIANSKNVAGRIQKFYKRDSTVIYPPVDIPELRIKNYELRKGQEDIKNGNHNSKFMLHDSEYYLTGGRLARPKHIDLIVKTCAELGLPLKVFGKDFAGYGDELKKLAGDKTEFLGEVTDEEKYELMSGAKAFIFAAEDEDFGITPVEAMGCGVPVIAYRSGGVVESVVEGKTGLFFDELTVKGLSKAIEELEKAKIKSEECIERAEDFSKERFKTEVQLFVEKAFRLSTQN